MEDFSASFASGGITAALIALIYTGIKIMQRSRCHSDSKCCKVDIDAEVQKKKTERAELVSIIIEQLRGERERQEGELDKLASRL